MRKIYKVDRLRRIIAYAWKSPTHADIVSKALEILDNDGYREQHAFFAAYADILTEYATVPDRKGDTDKGKGYHYYCAKNVHGKRAVPTDSGYYKSGKNATTPSRYSRSARSIFEDDYQLALTFFASGGVENFAISMQFVGRCMHMISDVCCTPHTTDLTLTSSKSGRHKLFEQYARDIYQRFHAKNGFDSIYSKHFEESTVGEHMNDLAAMSAEYYDILIKAKKPTELDSAIENMLCLAQRSCAAFLLRFYKDAANKELALQNGKTYYLRSAANGRYLSSKGCFKSGVSLSKTAEKLILTANAQGFYELAFENGYKLSLAKKKEAQYELKIGKSANGYRILTGTSRFINAVTGANNGCVYSKQYDPDDLFQCWYFEAAE